MRQRFDVVGVLVLAVAAGLGGGMLRDVLIGAVPPVGISDWRLLSAAAVAGIITFLFHPRLSRIARAVTLLDALGLGLFAVAGTLKALELGTTSLTAVVVGVLTAVGGGAVRDLLAGGPPRVLVERELYAIPAILGAVVYASLWSAGLVSPFVTWGCVALTVTVRGFGARSELAGAGSATATRRDIAHRFATIRDSVERRGGVRVRRQPRPVRWLE